MEQTHPRSTTPVSLSSWMNACARGKIEALEKMTNGLPWPDLQSRIPQTTSLALAAWNGHEEICRRLLDHKPLLEARDEQERTPIFAAIDGGHHRIVAMMLEKGASVEAQDEQGVTPLWFAVDRKEMKIVKMLLAHGADKTVNMRNNLGYSLLDLTAGSPRLGGFVDGTDSDMTRVLLEHGAKPDVKLPPGETSPLMKAAFAGSTNSARALIEHGARVNRICQGHTALHVAASKKNAEMVELLLRYGARLSIKDKNGKTPLQWAKVNNWNEFEAIAGEVMAAMQQEKLDRRTKTAKASVGRRRL